MRINNPRYASELPYDDTHKTSGCTNALSPWFYLNPSFEDSVTQDYKSYFMGGENDKLVYCIERI